jgi:LysR family transcriptional regulator, nod-box dependent transcriptional activator
MSNSLARLRHYFDDELLVQIGRKIGLAPRAENLHAAVRDLLRRIDSTIADEPVFDPRGSDRMYRILAFDYPQLVLVPSLLALTTNAGRHGALRVPAPGLDAQRQLERGEADLLIIPTG